MFEFFCSIILQAPLVKSGRVHLCSAAQGLYRNDGKQYGEIVAASYTTGMLWQGTFIYPTKGLQLIHRVDKDTAYLISIVEILNDFCRWDPNKVCYKG